MGVVQMSELQRAIQRAAESNCKDLTRTRDSSIWWLAEFLDDAVRDVNPVVLGAYGIEASTREDAGRQLIAKYGGNREH